MATTSKQANNNLKQTQRLEALRQSHAKNLARNEKIRENLNNKVQQAQINVAKLQAHTEKRAGLQGSENNQSQKNDTNKTSDIFLLTAFITILSIPFKIFISIQMLLFRLFVPEAPKNNAALSDGRTFNVQNADVNNDVIHNAQIEQMEEEMSDEFAVQIEGDLDQINEQIAQMDGETSDEFADQIEGYQAQVEEVMSDVFDDQIEGHTEQIEGDTIINDASRPPAFNPYLNEGETPAFSGNVFQRQTASIDSDMRTPSAPPPSFNPAASQKGPEFSQNAQAVQHDASHPPASNPYLNEGETRGFSENAFKTQQASIAPDMPAPSAPSFDDANPFSP